MLDSVDIERIEYQAIYDYINNVIQERNYGNEVIRGEVQKWTDADDYYTVPGSCSIPGSTIQGWIIDRFESVIDEFLEKSNNAQSIEDLAGDIDLYDEKSYYDFVYDICDSVEDYFWESDVYQELCNRYFENHADEDYE